MPGHDSKYEMSCRYAAKCGGRFLFRWHDNVIPTYEIERWASMDNGTPRMLAHFRSGRIQNSRRGSEVSRNCLLFDHPPLFSWKLFSYNYLDICRKWNYWNVIIVIKILGKYIIYFMFFWNMYIFVIDNYKINLYLINFCNYCENSCIQNAKEVSSKDYITLTI